VGSKRNGRGGGWSGRKGDKKGVIRKQGRSLMQKGKENGSLGGKGCGEQENVRKRGRRDGMVGKAEGMRGMGRMERGQRGGVDSTKEVDVVRLLRNPCKFFIGLKIEEVGKAEWGGLVRPGEG